jgi:hypothetical protein
MNRVAETVIIMRKSFLYIFLVVIAAACSNKKVNLVGSWQVAKVENPHLEREIANAKIDIDTTGSNDPLIAKYINLDSLKQIRMALLENDLAEQRMLQESLRFNFSENSRVYISSNGTSDSAMYRIEEDSVLYLDGPALTGIGEVDVYGILYTGKDSLVLRNINMTDTITIFMKRAVSDK